MNYNTYRADIDGLRALAVLSVILFHLDVALFRGGFIGVDIFFVISGFLITRLIAAEVERKKSFSFSNFYTRRAKRIFPALFFTLWLSLVLAHIFFPPQHYERFGGALLHAISSLSNFYFWNETGYFDTASEFKPLLHTWSLSVEEQFYLLWPLTLVFLLKSSRNYMAPMLIATIGVGSYILNHLFGDGSVEFLNSLAPSVGAWFSDGRTTIFYLTPFRVFEFSIGGLAVWLIRFQPKNKFIPEALFLLGLGMVAYPILTYTKFIIFPSYNALLPCFGAMLLIYGGTTARHGTKLLANPLAVHVGLISYSFYLIHWPLIVFYKYRKLDGLVASDKYFLLLLSYLAAVLMYHFIEQPVRRGALSKLWSNGGYGFACLLLTMTLILPAANIWATHGWTWRFPAKIVHMLSFNSELYDQYVWKRLNELEKNFADNGKPKVLVIGDSMAADFVNLLAEGDSLDQFDLVSLPVRDGCRAIFPLPEHIYQEYLSRNIDTCKKNHQAIMDSPLLKQTDSVVLASPWDHWSVELIAGTVAYIKKKGVKRVAVIGLKQQSVDGVKFIARQALRTQSIELGSSMENHSTVINAKIQNIEADFLYIDLLNYFCDDSTCRRLTDNGELIIYDKSHFSPHGARYIGLKAHGAEWMMALGPGGA